MQTEWNWSEPVELPGVKWGGGGGSLGMFVGLQLDMEGD
jgi:hypothetical protein